MIVIIVSRTWGGRLGQIIPIHTATLMASVPIGHVGKHGENTERCCPAGSQHSAGCKSLPACPLHDSLDALRNRTYLRARAANSYRCEVCDAFLTSPTFVLHKAEDHCGPGGEFVPQSRRSDASSCVLVAPTGARALGRVHIAVEPTTNQGPPARVGVSDVCRTGVRKRRGPLKTKLRGRLLASLGGARALCFVVRRSPDTLVARRARR
jgi:hypothetical protein